MDNDLLEILGMGSSHKVLGSLFGRPTSTITGEQIPTFDEKMLKLKELAQTMKILGEFGANVAPGSGEAIAVGDTLASGNKAEIALSEGRYKDAGFDYLDAFTNSVGTIPLLGGIFRGIKGAGKVADFLPLAKKMRKAGETSEAVRKETGWFKGMDGMWRSEIDDDAARIIGQNTKGNNDYVPFKDVMKEARSKHFRVTELGDVFKHDKLYEAYPSLPWDYKISEIPANSASMRGAKGYVSGKNIYISDDLNMGEAREVILHELQHTVQGIEGFARGGSVEEFLNPAMKGKHKIESQISELNKQMSDAIGTPRYSELMNKREGLVGKLQELGYQDTINMQGTANDQYRSLAGEIEARDAVGRLDMGASGRTIFPPNLQDDAIVRFR